MSELNIKTLEDFRKHVRKTVGDVGLITATEKESYGDVTPVTSLSLGLAIGIGGIPKNKFTIIDGEYSSGKSTTAYDVIGNCQKKYGNECLLIDKEDSYTTDYGKTLGIDNEKLTIVSPHTLEDMYDVLISALQSKLFGCIVVDSLTSFAPEARFEGSETMGLEARVNSSKLRMVLDALKDSNTALIMILQTRQKIGGYGDPTTTSGGVSPGFYCNLRIRITRSKIDREAQENLMKLTVVKNKFAPPYRISSVILKWGEGFSISSEIAELAVELGIIGPSGRSYVLPEVEDKIIGKKKLLEFLDANPEYLESVLKPQVITLLDSNPVRVNESDEEIGQ